MVIDGDMRVFPTEARDARASIAMNPMPDAREARERFHIEMDQVAGLRPLISGNGRRGRAVSRAKRLSPARTRIAATVDRGTWS
jgi:hypothetical protein